MTPSEFLTLLWGEKPAGQVLIWTLPDKRSVWFSDFSNVDRFAGANAGKDVYTGVSLASREVRLSDRQRITNAQSAGIAGLWADIDIAGEGHQKQNLPNNTESIHWAMLPTFIGELGYEPSITIHSGHGFQCWWLFEKPWIFADDQERKQAQQLTYDWHNLLVKQFTKYGWTLDSIHDLARVLRLPGTVNHKAEPKPVKVLAVSDFRWRDIPVLPHTTSERPQDYVLQPSVGELHLSPDLQPPPLKLEVLLEMDAKFAKSWAGERTDFKDGDQSASVYDLSLASLAAGAKWTDQEIAALLVAHRRRNGQDLKLRQDYYQRTISKARSEA